MQITDQDVAALSTWIAPKNLVQSDANATKITSYLAKLGALITHENLTAATETLKNELAWFPASGPAKDIRTRNERLLDAGVVPDPRPSHSLDGANDKAKLEQWNLARAARQQDARAREKREALKMASTIVVQRGDGRTDYLKTEEAVKKEIARVEKLYAA